MILQMLLEENAANERYLQGGEFCIYYIGQETGRMIYENNYDDFRRLSSPGFVAQSIFGYRGLLNTAVLFIESTEGLDI